MKMTLDQMTRHAAIMHAERDMAYAAVDALRAEVHLLKAELSRRPDLANLPPSLGFYRPYAGAACVPIYATQDKSK